MPYKAKKIENKKNAWLVLDETTGKQHTVYCKLNDNTEQAAIHTLEQSFEPPPPPSNTEIASDVRIDRNRLLKESDWTQVPDAPVDQAAWAEYRQALRDLPLQTGFPTDIDWPTKPE